MANMLQSTQTQASQAPSFYTNYLTNVASKATGMLPGGACAPQYVGAQPLQQQAFETACSTKGTYQPFVQTGVGYIGCAASQDITGASAPYLQAGSKVSPLCAAKPLVCQATNLNLAGLAGSYMSPYICKAVNQMSDIAMRNIRQNLAPQATAAAVGSGQFGSQRGAQVLGQTEANAMQDLNSQIANMLNTGYTTAMCAAKYKQNALDTLASTVAQAQGAQNTAQIQAAQAATCAAYKQAYALQQAGLGMGTLGQTGQNLNLACINALATLGGQQQTIAQNQQNFPLSTLSNLASILQGYSIPTTTQTTLCMSPLSAAAAIGSGTMGILQPTRYDAKGNPIACSSLLNQAWKSISGLTSNNNATQNVNTSSTSAGANDQTAGIGGGASYVGKNGTGTDIYYDPSTGQYTDQNGTVVPISGCASGGSVQSRAIGGSIGCRSTRHRGGLSD